MGASSFWIGVILFVAGVYLCRTNVNMRTEMVTEPIPFIVGFVCMAVGLIYCIGFLVVQLVAGDW